MKIQIKNDAVSGKVVIPKGEYWVSLNNEAQQIFLTAGGKDLKIPATKRRSTAKTKTTTVVFYSGGGTTWSLVVNTPKHGEWVAFIEYGKSS
jgi:hypothetical protein